MIKWDHRQGSISTCAKIGGLGRRNGFKQSHNIHLIKLINEVVEIIGDFRLGRLAQNQDVVEEALDVRLDGVGGPLEELLAQRTCVLVRPLCRTHDLRR